MIRLYKPARSKNLNRGMFSYLTESVINLTNFIYKNKNWDIKYYHDLFNIPGYTEGNLFDVSFIQDSYDYDHNKNMYKNIEDVDNLLIFNLSEINNEFNEFRLLSEKVISNFFVPIPELEKILIERQSQINFEKTIGVHRRSTDMTMHQKIVDLKDIFNSIEENEFENIFLMCDNLLDLKIIKNRYGNKIITYDEFTSEVIDLPFFKVNDNLEKIKNHIKEMVFGSFTLAKTKNLICTNSNVSAFSIFSNSKLKYKLLL
jgi:hypothetical protein